ncbi:MAG TPA: PD-(D/E)XK nuclease family protein, partial [Vicinamibacteria bacterium]
MALSETLRELEGPASWHEWSVRLRRALDLWVGEERDREAVAAVLADLATLGWASERASRAEVEDVLLARLEWERAPLVPPAQGGVHVGALDALAGIPFRVVAIPGLVEGGYPGPVRQDPFLLDPEREALAAPAAAPARPERRQLSLFDEARAPGTWKVGPLPTSQDRLVEARRHFHRALAQATERIILSYPRADPRTGRERLPSLFFVQAASALEGRPLDMSALGPLLVEDEPRRLDTALAVDASERDRSRVLVGGHEASSAIAAGWPVFGASLRAAAARRSSRLTRYDGLVDLGDGLPAGLDPTISGRPLSATRIRTYADCGFQYLLRHVLRLEAVLEPEDRMGLDPLERGSVFHEVAERFLRERRQRGELPVRDSEVLRRRLVELGEEALARLVVASPP